MYRKERDVQSRILYNFKDPHLLIEKHGTKVKRISTGIVPRRAHFKKWGAFKAKFQKRKEMATLAQKRVLSKRAKKRHFPVVCRL